MIFTGKKQKKHFFKKALCMILVPLMILQSAGASSFAWEQPAHEEINAAAIKKFEATYAKSAKYRNAKVFLDRFVDAPNVTSSGKFSITYNQMWFYRSARDQIISGGFSADEPNLYVSVKHFFDPLALSGVSQLTDQSSMHGLAYEALPATEWAVSRAENPYSLINAMNNYRKGLEIPSDSAVSPLPVLGDFRDFAGDPKTVEEMRSYYLGKGLRGLGEVMHLVADMTSPAHVRNDSHPLYEISEQTMTETVASLLVRFPRTDSFTVAAAGDTVLELMTSLSGYTNNNFYSSDTIADIASGISPNNGEGSYPSPNLSTMTKKTSSDGVTVWYSNFGGKKVPMFQVLPGWVYNDYEITPEFAIIQGEVQLPLAVAADANVINMFLPTLKASQTMTETAPDADMLAIAQKGGCEELKQYAMTGAMTHQIESDPQWSAIGPAIQYSGPGEIWRTRGGRSAKICDVEYAGGQLVKYQDPETGEMTDGQPTFWLPLGAEKKLSFGFSAIDYIVELGDAVYTVTHPGIQTVQSDPTVFTQDPTEITLTADRTTVMPGEKVKFSVDIQNVPERYKIEWTFGDEADQEGAVKPPVLNRSKAMTHIYKKEKDYEVTVRVIDLKRGAAVAEDTVTLSAELGELEGSWGITMLVEEENQFFKSLVVGLMKMIIQYLISPLVEAISGEAIDPSVVDSFSFVGTTLEYTLDLAKTDDTGTSYQGPLTYVGSNTGYLEGSGDIAGLRMEIRDGEIVFVAIGTNEDGNTVEFDYLKGGKMVSPTQIEGTFDLTGIMSGSWTAVKK